MKTPGWYAVRIELAAAIGPGAVVGAIALLWPPTRGPMFDVPPPDLFSMSLPLLGFVVYLVGLAWMIRIYRADPEAGRSWFRFGRS